MTCSGCTVYMDASVRLCQGNVAALTGPSNQEPSKSKYENNGLVCTMRSVNLWTHSPRRMDYRRRRGCAAKRKRCSSCATSTRNSWWRGGSNCLLNCPSRPAGSQRGERMVSQATNWTLQLSYFEGSLASWALGTCLLCLTNNPALHKAHCAVFLLQF